MKRTLKSLAWYAAGALLPCLVLFLVFLKRPVDLHVPFVYAGDAMGLVSVVKSLAEGDWFPYLGVHTDRLGAPFGFSLGDYPTPELLQYLILKGLSLFDRDAFFLVNVYFLLTFPFTSVLAQAIFRMLGFRRLAAFTFGVLYAFLPFHANRYGHLFLAAIYLVPPACLLLLWLWRRRPLFFARRDGRWRPDFLRRDSLVALAVAFLIGIWHAYYAFFFCAFVSLAALSAVLYRRSLWPALSAFVLVLVTAGSLSLAMASNRSYVREHGVNLQVGQRADWEAELFGLKLSNLIVPRGDNRYTLMRKISARHHAWTPYVEGRDEPLGAFGVVGIFLLFGRLIWMTRRHSTQWKLAVLFGGGLLYATIGGLASHFNSLVTPAIRSVNRISPFLGFFAWTAFGLSVKGWLSERSRRPWLAFGLAALLGAVGLYDLIGGNMKFGSGASAEFYGERAFIREIESKIPRGGAILQLPFMEYPEVPPIHRMPDYSHFRAYVHSEHARWSYGAMRGRPASERIREVSALPLDLARVRGMGYVGLFIDRLGFEDNGRAIVEDLSRRLNSPPLESANGRLVFFGI